MVSVSTRRQQVAYARARGVSCRRACVLLSVARASLHYESKMAVKDAPVVARMHVHSARYPRWGYRRVRILLGRDGVRMSPGRAYRLWKKAGLQVPKKRRRRRIAASRAQPHAPTGPNQVWAYDFVFDACANGQKLKCLTVVDEWTHEALAIDVGGSIRSTRVIEILDRLVAERGAPKTLCSDNGPELARVLRRWKLHGFAERYGRPPRPEDFICPDARTMQALTPGRTSKAPDTDCPALGIPDKGNHALRRYFITYARRGGARKDMLERVTHNARGDILDVYTAADGIWPALCEAKSPTAFTRLLAPAVGLEPTTKRLTVARSTN